MSVIQRGFWADEGGAGTPDPLIEDGFVVIATVILAERAAIHRRRVVLVAIRGHG
jgi:hypothetical protein